MCLFYLFWAFKGFHVITLNVFWTSLGVMLESASSGSLNSNSLVVTPQGSDRTFEFLSKVIILPCLIHLSTL